MCSAASDRTSTHWEETAWSWVVAAEKRSLSRCEQCTGHNVTPCCPFRFPCFWTTASSGLRGSSKALEGFCPLSQRWSVWLKGLQGANSSAEYLLVFIQTLPPPLEALCIVEMKESEKWCCVLQIMEKEIKLRSNNKKRIAAATDLNNDMHEHQNEEEKGFKWLWTCWTWLSAPDRLQVGVFDKLIDLLDHQMGPTGPKRGNIQSAAVVWRKTCSRYQTSWRPKEGDGDINNLWRSAEHYLWTDNTSKPKSSVEIHSAATLLGPRRCWVWGHRAFQQLGPFSQITWKCLRCYQMINSSQDFRCSVPLFSLDSEIPIHCPGKTPDARPCFLMSCL